MNTRMTKISSEEKASYLRDAVFAASDGLITTFAVVSGVQGASLTPAIVIVMGFANLFADGFSMASGNYLGVKSEIEYEKAEGKRALESSPLKQALVTFVAFNVSGVFPLLPYLFNVENKFLWSVVAVSLLMFLIGFSKSSFTRKNPIRSGLEMLFVGGVASAVAFYTGRLLNFLVQ